MKSIMQEASSVAKAIEQGWIKAGKPQEFSIKVFEEAQKNFLGLTTKSAKIALLFNESSVQNAEKSHGRTSRPQAQPRARTENPIQEKKLDRPRPAQPTARPTTTERRPLERRPLNSAEAPKTEQKPRQRVAESDHSRTATWADDMKNEAQTWMQNSLNLLGLGHVQFTATTHQNVLSFEYSAPLVTNNERQRHLFRSFAFLIMQTLRQQFKRSCRNLRITFSTPRPSE